MSIDEERLTALARHFRIAIEQTKKHKLPSWFMDFPRGCCGDTADLLGVYLEDLGMQDVRHVWAMHGEVSHAWIEVNGIVVDITSDQFPEFTDSVVVADPSRWHENLTDRKCREVDRSNVSCNLAPALRAIEESINILRPFELP